MQESNLESVTGMCVCGRKLENADVYVYRSHTDCCIFHRCQCGAEWTEHRTDIDPTAPVTSDEVIEVHIRLAKLEGSILELLQQYS